MIVGDGSSQGGLTFPYDRSISDRRLKFRAKLTVFFAVIAWALFITWCFVGSNYLLGFALGILIAAVMVRIGRPKRVFGS